MNYELLLSYVGKGENIFLTGPGGSGKSTMINKLRSEIELQITSTTGVSAFNISGRTIHNFCGLGAISKGDSFPHIMKKVKKNKPAVERILSVNILVIDEISMLGKFSLETIDSIFKDIRKNQKPMGGVQLIFTGDFLQIPPVNDDYCFTSQVWKELSIKTIKLETLYRFTDQTYVEMLGRIRYAQHTAEDNKELFKRFFAYNELDLSSLEIQPTYLCSKRHNVNDKNNEELEKNPNKKVSFKAFCDIPNITVFDSVAPPVLDVKLGAQVMLTINLDVESGLVNGSRGVIVGIDEIAQTITVKFLNGMVLPFSRHKFIHEEDGKVIVEYHQFPFILAYALSIHKVQGCTLDCAVVDIGYSVFEASMAYVALSRVRSLDSLYVKAYRPDKIFVNSEVLEFYNIL